MRDPDARGAYHVVDTVERDTFLQKRVTYSLAGCQKSSSSSIMAASGEYKTEKYGKKYKVKWAERKKKSLVQCAATGSMLKISYRLIIGQTIY
jgi:hypothetical protein